MTELTFVKAEKTQAKLRLALFGPSGSGKTFTALRLAKGMGGRVALIDTERGSASKYADRFEFDTLILEEKDIEAYRKAIGVALGYDVLIIDSLSHAWQELLGEVDKLAKAKYRGNTWSAWNEGTPKQRALIDAILEFNGHIIATMRSKTEWTTSEEGGKVKPIRVGLAPEQGKGIEYEFDLLMELSPEHMAVVLKDRTGKFQDATFDKPGEDLGAKLAAWLQEGEPAPEKPKAANGHRPYPPDVLRTRLQEIAEKKAGATATDEQRGLLAGMMELAFAGEPDADRKRRTVLHALWNVESAKELDGPAITATLKWLNLSKDSGGASKPDPMAVREIQAVLREALIEAGQEELPI